MLPLNAEQLQEHINRHWNQNITIPIMDCDITFVTLVMKMDKVRGYHLGPKQIRILSFSTICC